MVDTVPTTRTEGETLIIPVLEETLVVEKRLVLKEEIHITRRRTETVEQARVVLREEEVNISRIDEEGSGTHRAESTSTTDPLELDRDVGQRDPRNNV